jgi:hypothetical protein
MARTIQIIFVIITSILCFIFGFLLGLDLSGTQQKRNFIFGALVQSNENLSTTYKQSIIESFPDGCNSTHLWSMRLADENYFRLARLLPCRNVS